MNFQVGSQIRKQELPGLVNGTVSIVGKHNPQEMGVQPFFDLLVEKQAQLEICTEPRSKHPLSIPIANDRKKVVEVAKAIVLQGRAVEKANLTEMSDSALPVLIPIKKYLGDLDNVNSKALEKNVKSFLSVIEVDVLVGGAATKIGINVYVDELKLLTARLESNIAKRRADKAARRTIVETKLLKSIIKALTNLLKAIELAEVQNSEKDYTPLKAELNELFISFRTVIRSRSTRNKNATLIKETAALSATTTATVE